MKVRHDVRSPVRGERRSSGRTALLLATLATLAGLLAIPSPASAQAPVEIGTSATVGHGRGTNPLSWTFVEITSSPSIPIAGQIEVRVHGPDGRSAVTRDLEVSAGATKVLHLLLPPADDLQVLFLPAGGGDQVPLATGGNRNRTAVLVGGLGAAPELPDPLSTAGTDRPVRGVVVDPAALDLGARALESLDALWVDPASLAAMTADERAEIEVAVVAGLDLLVPISEGDAEIPLAWDPVGSVTATAAGSSLTPAPTAWPLRLTDLGVDDADDQVVAAATNAGRGRVVAVADGFVASATSDQTTALWRAILQPRAELVRELGGGDDGDLGARMFGGSTSLPGARGAALFLLAFLVLVGPVNALVVRRLGRRELSWVTIPAIALVFTGVAALSTAGGGQAPSPVLRAAWWLDGVGHEITAVGVQAPGRGVQQVSFPGGRDTMVHHPWGNTVGTSERVGDTTVLGARLDALQVITAVGWGRPDVGPPLEVSARATPGGGLEVTIANTIDVDLEDVRVDVATRREEVGRLTAGETTTVVVDELGVTMPASRVAGGRMLGGPRPAAPAPGPGAAGRLLAWSPLDGSPGTVWVSGHTIDDLGLAVPQVAGGIEDRGTFVAVGVVPDHGAGADGLAPHLVRRDLLREDHEWMPWRPDPLTVEGQEEVVLRFRLPSPAIEGELVSTLDRGGPFDQHMMNDPWADGCFEVTDLDANGEQVGDPEERCGDQVACPDGANECGGDDRRIEACFPDGRCQLAVRTGPVEAADEPIPDGFEVYDHRADRWVPATTGLGDGADTAAVISPLGEVLVRARQVGWFEFAQRGLALTGGGDA